MTGWRCTIADAHGACDVVSVRVCIVAGLEEVWEALHIHVDITSTDLQPDLEVLDDVLQCASWSALPT